MEDWQTVVMESKVPVILDCFAEWCQPCTRLKPLLQQKVLAYEGKLKLVMLDIDSFPQLTQGLNIRSVPSVFLIYKGSIVDMFQGMPKEDQLD